MALRAERLKDKVVLDQVTSEFVDDVIQIIHGTFDLSRSATTKKLHSIKNWHHFLTKNFGENSMKH